MDDFWTGLGKQFEKMKDELAAYDYIEQYYKSLEDLKKLSTPRLLAYYKKHLRGLPSKATYQFDCGNISEKRCEVVTDFCNKVKAELDKREHVE